jgi:hypothetical protein
MLRFHASSVALALFFCAPAMAQTAIFPAHFEKNCFSRLRHDCTVTISGPADHVVRSGRVTISGDEWFQVSVVYPSAAHR